MTQERCDPRRGPLFLMGAMLLAAMAAGMGWGIRGQYGHETGAMIAGALTSLALVMLFVPRSSSLHAARAAAMMTAAIGIGGSMTYGQTVGLTHDAEVIGNWEALRWGLLGLFVKGAIWIGFAGTFLGMGLGGKRYHPLEMAVLLPALLGLMFLGAWLINSPFDPSTKILPWIYFSDDWYFEPGRELKPRPEVWGGLLVALLSLVVYVRLVRRDRLAGRMALVGMLGGGVGFAAGQCVQAFPRWNPEVFTEGALSAYSEYFRHFNWWNMMETTFGLIFGATLAMGLWINRRFIATEDAPDEVFISPPWEVLLVVMHVVLLLSTEFLNLTGFAAHLRAYTAFGLLMTILPMVGVVGGRFWPYLMLLPIVAAPIVGKTLKNLTYESGEVSVADGWLLIVQVPMAIMVVAATWLIYRGIKRQSARLFAAIGLLLTTLLYFGLNTAFFRYAWPWEEWTGRTPNQVIFSVCAWALVVASVICAAAELVKSNRWTVATKLVLTFVVCLLPISLAAAQPADRDTSTGHQATDDLIKSITKETLFRNRDGSGTTWFHPRACMVPGANGRPTALMNLQEIGGSDYFGQVHWSESDDLGSTWSKPQLIAALGRDPVEGHPGLQAGVCDVTPQYHPPTRTVLALGHVVFYRGPRFASGDQLARYPVYVVRRRDGSWSRRKILKWDDPRGGHIYSNNCGQRVVMPGGDIMMSFTFGAEADNRMVAGVRCSFDGEELRVIDVGKGRFQRTIPDRHFF